MRRSIIAAVLIAVAATLVTAMPAVAKEAKTDDAAVDAFEHYVDQLNKRQWGRLYALLYPAQRKLVADDAFTACMDERPNVTITDVDVSETYHEKATVPGTNRPVDTVAITLEMTATDGSQTQTQTDTVHMIYAKGRWRFALTGAQLDACRGVAST
jgi:hypothetical protein